MQARKMGKFRKGHRLKSHSERHPRARWEHLGYSASKMVELDDNCVRKMRTPSELANPDISKTFWIPESGRVTYDKAWAVRNDQRRTTAMFEGENLDEVGEQDSVRWWRKVLLRGRDVD
jgi:hypothetical protein